MVYTHQSRRQDNPSPLQSLSESWPDLRPPVEQDVYPARELAQTIHNLLPERLQELITPDFWNTSPDSEVLYQLIGADSVGKVIVQLEFVDLRDDQGRHATQSALLNPEIFYQIADGTSGLASDREHKVKKIALAQLVGADHMEEQQVAEWVPGGASCFAYDRLDGWNRIDLQYQFHNSAALDVLIEHLLEKYQEPEVQNKQDTPNEDDFEDMVASLKKGSKEVSAQQLMQEQWSEETDAAQEQFSYLEHVIQDNLRARLARVGINLELQEKPAILSVTQPNPDQPILEVAWEAPVESSSLETAPEVLLFEAHLESGFLKLDDLSISH